MRKSLRGRFRVWDLGTDQYNHSDLVYNWDKLDEIVGGTDGSTGLSNSQAYPANVDSRWLGSTSKILNNSPNYPGGDYGSVVQQEGGRTLYTIAAGLNFNDVPLGTVVAWWRPAAGLEVPNGWEICDGRTITKHSFPTSGASITLPDLRNKTILGSSTTQAVNAVGGVYEINQTLKAGASDGPTGAPGLGYDVSAEAGWPTATGAMSRSGTNYVRDLTHYHDANVPGGSSLTIPNHTHDISKHTHKISDHYHPITPHTHNFAHQHVMPDHFHYGDDSNATKPFDMGPPYGTKADNNGLRKVRAADDAYQNYHIVASAGHVHNVTPKNYTGTVFQASNKATGNPINLDTSLGGPNRTEKSITDINGTQTATYTETAVSSIDNKSAASTGSTVVNNVVQGHTANATMSVNPRTEYVGLLYIMKVRVSTNII